MAVYETANGERIQGRNIRVIRRNNTGGAQPMPVSRPIFAPQQMCYMGQPQMACYPQPSYYQQPMCYAGQPPMYSTTGDKFMNLGALATVLGMGANIFTDEGSDANQTWTKVTQAGLGTMGVGGALNLLSSNGGMGGMFCGLF